MSTKNVEILLAAYNGEKFIREQIDSILNQTDTHWHLTVSDDGSTDGTPAILEAYAAQFPEKISLYHSNIRFGNARDHFFHLMRQCEAPHILFSDQDDVWRPDKVERMMRALLEAEAEVGADTPVLVFTDLTPVDEKLRPIAPSLMRMQQQYADTIDYRALLMQNIVTGCATGINRALALLADRCADTSQVIMHDWWLGVVAARFGKVVYLDESTILYRQHGGNCVGAKNAGSVRESLYRLLHIHQLRTSIAAKKRQAGFYLRVYGECFKPEELSFLNAFILEKSGPAFYWRHRRLIHGFSRLAGMMLLG